MMKRFFRFLRTFKANFMETMKMRRDNEVNYLIEIQQTIRIEKYREKTIDRTQD